jgi:hypothetical protein
MKHPIQPLENDEMGVPRFHPNRIVQHLLEVGKQNGCGLNELACMDFSRDDREQFAQLVGYSLGGFAELSYATDDTVEAARLMLKGDTEEQARIKSMQAALDGLRGAIRDAATIAFNVHPDDLRP